MGGRSDLSVCPSGFSKNSLGLERSISGLERHLRIRACFQHWLRGFYSRFLDYCLFWFAGWNEIGCDEAAVERAACELCFG